MHTTPVMLAARGHIAILMDGITHIAALKVAPIEGVIVLIPEVDIIACLQAAHQIQATGVNHL